MEPLQLWSEVFELMNRAKSKIKHKVRNITEKIDECYGEVLSSLARELGVDMILAIENSMDNPLLIVPTLYIITPRRSSLHERKELLKRVEETIRDWASHWRLDIRTTGVATPVTSDQLIRRYRAR